MTLTGIVALVCVGVIMIISPGLSATVPDTSVAAAGCEYHGTSYSDGQKFNPGVCTACFCHNGKTSCYEHHCPPPVCVDAVSHPNQCCPVCPHGHNCRAPDGTTIQGGVTVQINATTSCTCREHHFLQPIIITTHAACLTK